LAVEAVKTLVKITADAGRACIASGTATAAAATATKFLPRTREVLRGVRTDVNDDRGFKAIFFQLLAHQNVTERG
jgi:hypothetical protein